MFDGTHLTALFRPIETTSFAVLSLFSSSCSNIAVHSGQKITKKVKDVICNLGAKIQFKKKRLNIDFGEKIQQF